MLFIHFTNGGQYWHYRLQCNPAMNPPSFLMYGTECRTHFKTYLNNIFIYKNSYKQDKYRQMTEVCICVTKKVPQCIWLPGCMWRPSNVSLECVEALQPPLSEEAVCLVGCILVVTPSWYTEVGQHWLVALPLRCLLAILFIIVPEKRFTRTKIVF